MGGDAGEEGESLVVEVGGGWGCSQLECGGTSLGASFRLGRARAVELPLDQFQSRQSIMEMLRLGFDDREGTRLMQRRRWWGES